MEYKRGDIFYIHKQPTYGSEQEAGRPGIIVSNNSNNRFSSVLEVVYLTTRHKPELPTHAEITANGTTSTVLCEQISSVSVNRIGDYITSLTDSEMKPVDDALKASLNLNSEPPKFISPIQPENSSDIVIKTERDLYKRLYEQLLEKLSK